jgi:hypothetical protein
VNARRSELVPLAVRFAVRDALGGWGGLTVAQIGDLFRVEGFGPPHDYEPTSSGARRQEAERFQAGIDFTSPDEVDRYLRVVESVLDEYDSQDGRERHDRLLKALRRAGIERDERGRLRHPGRGLSLPARLKLMPSESDIRLHAARLDRMDQEPEELIGAAKELVEATAKYVLLQLGEEVGSKDDMPALSKRALMRLKMHPDAIAPTTKGAEVMVRILAGLSAIAAGMAELRNMGYGTGHGRGNRVAGLAQRHAEFCARSAVAYATFLLDTLGDPSAPWRDEQESSRG